MAVATSISFAEKTGMAADMRWLSALRTATIAMLKVWIDTKESSIEDYQLIAEDQAREMLARCMDLEYEMTNKYGSDHATILSMVILTYGEEAIKQLLKIN